MPSAVLSRFLILAAFSGLFLFSSAQPGYPGDKARPYRVFSSGKQVTVKSSKDIKNIMVWSASGHRILEQNNINAPSYTFNLNVREKIFFLMLELKGGERYTEKIGVQ